MAAGREIDDSGMRRISSPSGTPRKRGGQTRFRGYICPMPCITRRQTVTATIGDVPLGSGHPIVVQSMTNTDTADVAATVQQVADLANAGSELVRVTVNNEESAVAVPEIADRLQDMGVTVPIVGDVHYNGHLLLTRHPA